MKTDLTKLHEEIEKFLKEIREDIYYQIDLFEEEELYADKNFYIEKEFTIPIKKNHKK